jgi:glutamyl endopeptidase
LLILIGLGSYATTASAQAGTPDVTVARATNQMVSSDGKFVTDAAAVDQATGTDPLVSPASPGTGQLAPAGTPPTDAGGKPVGTDPADTGSPDSLYVDWRHQIYTTTSYPYRAVVHIVSSLGSCTGFMIGPDTVATAGRCVYNYGWASWAVVYPGRNGSYVPYGACGAVRFYSQTYWTINRWPDHDYGAIKLNCTIGYNTGWFGFRWQSYSYTGQPVILTGYPTDKPYATMWQLDRLKITSSYPTALYYDNNRMFTSPTPGAPVWNSLNGCYNCAIAINSAQLVGQPCDYYGGCSGGGVRITQAAFNFLVSWKNAPR